MRVGLSLPRFNDLLSGQRHKRYLYSYCHKTDNYPPFSIGIYTRAFVHSSISCRSTFSRRSASDNSACFLAILSRYFLSLRSFIPSPSLPNDTFDTYVNCKSDREVSSFHTYSIAHTSILGRTSHIFAALLILISHASRL